MYSIDYAKYSIPVSVRLCRRRLARFFDVQPDRYQHILAGRDQIEAVKYVIASLMAGGSWTFVETTGYSFDIFISCSNLIIDLSKENLVLHYETTY